MREVHPWKKRRGRAFVRAIRREAPAFRRCYGERRPSEVAGLRLYLHRGPRAGVAELRKTRADPIWGILWTTQVRASLRRAPQGSTLRRNPEAVAKAVSAIVVEATPTPCAL